MAEQEQFLEVVDRDQAEQRFRAALRLDELSGETVRLADGLGRVLAEDVTAQIDVPSFDRSNYDGYAVKAADTFGAQEEKPQTLELLNEVIATAVVPSQEVQPGQAVSIATGGMLPRGADAVVMVEHADTQDRRLLVRKAVTPGFGVAYAGTDIANGETVLRQGELLTSRETGVLAAVGIDQVPVYRKPTVGILSTGDEIIAPGEPMRPGCVYDSNLRIIADAVRELGGVAVELGIVSDNLDSLRSAVRRAIADCDAVLLSGGTSKGAGDLSYRVVSELDDPGIVAHGVALKPGKPICLAASAGKAVVILPGFPTSAIFTFHEFVAPVIRKLAGRSDRQLGTVPARMAVKVNSEIGRTEYLLVGLVPPVGEGDDASSDREQRCVAFPMGKGSGSVTTFSRADGFVTIGRHEEILPAGADVGVRLLGRDLQVSDLVVIGSHCVGLDFLLGQLQQAGFRTKFLAVGSTAGLDAARLEQCDVAGIHLLDPESGTYNRPFLDKNSSLIEGYGRLQGLVYRTGDERFEGGTVEETIQRVAADPKCLMVNRNQGSGTRILIDRLLSGARPSGYGIQSRSHNAVAAAVSQGRADWGIAIEMVAQQPGLSFRGISEEQYDFVVPQGRLTRPAVVAFRDLLRNPATQNHLRECGFRI